MSTALDERVNALQKRVLGAGPSMPSDVRALFGEIRKYLLEAADEELLKSPPDIIIKLLKMVEDSKERGTAEILVGRANFKRSNDMPAFERDDGARFDFGITLRQEKSGLALIAYHFEIRFPEGCPGFVRFDLNPPGHKNEDKGLRAYLHPGHDDLQVPAPMMSPIEVLDVLVYGLRRSEGRKARS